MQIKENSFSFEKIFDEKNFDDELLKIDYSYTPCFLDQGILVKNKVDENLEKSKRKNLSESLECTDYGDFKKHQEELVKAYIDNIKFITDKYSKSIAIFKQNLAVFEHDFNILKKYLKNDFDFNYFKYNNYYHFKNLKSDIPDLEKALQNIYLVFDKYNTNSSDILGVLLKKYNGLIEYSRGQLLGEDKPIKEKDFINYTKQMFIDGVDNSVVISPETIKIKELDLDFKKYEKSIYDNFIKITKNNDALFKFINRTRSEYINSTETFSVERMFLNTITEICMYGLIAFQIKLDCINKFIQQNTNILVMIYKNNKNIQTNDSDVEHYIDPLKLFDNKNPLKNYDDIIINEYDFLNFEKIFTKCCLNEALIISEGINVEDRLYSLHESMLGTIVDTIKKIKNFIVSNIAKFNNWFNKYISTTKAYLEKYEKIITNNKLTGFDPVKIKDYPTGIKRINTPLDLSQLMQEVTKINAEMQSTTGNSLADEDNTDIYSLIIKDFKPKDEQGNNISFDEFCKNYFLGGEKETLKDADSFNTSDMYKFCYNTNDILEVLKNDQSKANQFLDSVSSSMEKAVNIAKQKEQEKQNNAQQQSQQQQANQAQTTNKESYNNYLGKTLFLQENIEVTKISNQTNNAINNKNVNSSIKNSTNDINNTANNIAGTASPNNIESQIKVLNKAAMAVQTYLKAKSFAAETICSDYMKLIKISVTYYISQQNK